MDISTTVEIKDLQINGFHIVDDAGEGRERREKEEEDKKRKREEEGRKEKKKRKRLFWILVMTQYSNLSAVLNQHHHGSQVRPKTQVLLLQSSPLKIMWI